MRDGTETVRGQPPAIENRGPGDEPFKPYAFSMEVWEDPQDDDHRSEGRWIICSVLIGLSGVSGLFVLSRFI